MSQATFIFHGELNDFRAPAERGSPLSYAFKDRVSLKDAIESLGVPHTEVESILVDATPAEFGQMVPDGARVEVFPASAGAEGGRLRPPLPGEPRFVLDTHLGRLATYLRMLGFDTLYRNDYADEELARIASDEQRILLTRDRGLLKRGIVTFGRYVRETDPERQIVEILRHYDLGDRIAPLRRCMRCNGLLHAVDKAAVYDRLPPKTREYYDEFSACSGCNQVYWKGSHYDRMRALIERLAADGRAD